MRNSDNGTASILHELLSGKKTVEQVREELEGNNAQMFLGSGKNYRPLHWNGFANIQIDGVETAVNVYSLGEKIDNHGQKVIAKPRAQKAATKRK